MYSIRRRLIATTIATVAIILCAAAVFLDLRIAREMQSLFDASLLAKARALVILTEELEGRIEFNFADEFMPEFEAESDPQYFQLWIDGQMFERSHSLGEADLPRVRSAQPGHRFEDIALLDKRAGRLVQIDFVPQVETDDDEEDDAEPHESPVSSSIGSLVVARERVSLDELRSTSRITIVMALAVALLVIGPLVAAIVGRGMRPLQQLAQQVGDVDPDKLGDRFLLTGPPSTELTPIQQQLNHMLERLRQAFEREKRFSANVAHELRTPVAELKSLGEVGSMHALSIDHGRAFFADALAISVRMEKIVDNLLALARADAGQLLVHATDFRLAPVIDAVWAGALHGRGKHLDNAVAWDIGVHTDRDKLETVLRNLLSNAAQYSPPGARVRVQSQRTSQGIALELCNPTTDLAQEDVVHMRDRLWRKDAARSDTGNLGLGLSLVDSMISVLNIDAEFELDARNVLCVRLSYMQPGSF